MADWNTVRNDPDYEEKLDDEIIPLCDALNAAGFTTTASCCGHGQRWPYVCFEHSTDERIENLARFILKEEQGDYRRDFSIFQKEICLEGCLWSLEIHLIDVYSDTPSSLFLEKAKSAINRVAKLVGAFGNSAGEIERKERR